MKIKKTSRLEMAHLKWLTIGSTILFSSHKRGLGINLFGGSDVLDLHRPHLGYVRECNNDNDDDDNNDDGDKNDDDDNNDDNNNDDDDDNNNDNSGRKVQK